nr:MAG TPA: hypothetical protein [Caudoviricetes sp.]
MLTREQYKQIKSMNREELDHYLDQMFIQGHNHGVFTMSEQVVSLVDKGIRMTSGVGEKRYQEIMNNIVQCMKEANNEGN